MEGGTVFAQFRIGSDDLRGLDITYLVGNSDFEGGPCSFSAAKHGAKKEGFLTKLKEKLPGHKKSADAAEFGGETDTTSPTTPPKKGLVTKLKEKLPGHHDSSTDV